MVDDENEPNGLRYTGTETYTPNEDGSYTGNKGGHLDKKPANKGRYPVQEQEGDGTTGRFRFKTQEQEEKENAAAQNDQDNSNSDDESSSDDSDSQDEDSTGGDQGYTPNHDDGMPAATPENMAWAKARQEWIDGGLVNPGNSPAADRPATDEISQTPVSNPRHGWAINPGPGNDNQVQPSVQDWTRKFKEIGLKDPPKPTLGVADGPAGVSTGPNVNQNVTGTSGSEMNP